MSQIHTAPQSQQELSAPVLDTAYTGGLPLAVEPGAPYYTPLHEGQRDAGGTTARFALAVGSVILTASCGAALGAWGNVRPKIVEDKGQSVTKVVDLLLKPVDFTCRTVRVSDGSGSRKVYNRVVLGDKIIPNASSTVIFETYYMTSSDCVKNGDQKAAAAAVTIKTTDAQPGKKYKSKFIQIPVESLVNITAPAAETGVNRIVFDHDDIPDLFYANQAQGAVAFKAACNLVSLGRAGDTCNAIAESLSKSREDAEAGLRATAEASVLAQARKQCGAANWPNTAAAMTDSYKDEAVRLADGDVAAADAVKVVFTKGGVETTDPPAFDGAYDEDLKKLGILTESDTLKFDTAIKVQCINPAPYVSKYSTATQPNSTATTGVNAGDAR